jgi:hypothetical protein
MNNIRKILCLYMGLLLFSSCAKTPQFITSTPSELVPVSKLAIELTQMVKKGIPVMDSLINIYPSGVNLENIEGYDQFTMHNIVILDAGYSSDGIYSQQALVESANRTGRIDLRDDRIAFKLRDPTPEEAARIEDDLYIFASKTLFKQLSKKEEAAFVKAIRKYQQDNGLKVDGVYGKDTAHSMAKQAPIVDILEITSEIVYPLEPRHATYIVPFTTVEKNPDQFYNGFDSLEAVKDNSIGLKEFPSMAKKGTQFTVFVYFFDRVDPYSPLSVRLSTSKLKATGSAGQKWYADPVKWPVLVETFTLNKDPKMLSGNLFISVCIEHSESNRCISSRQIQ